MNNKNGTVGRTPKLTKEEIIHVIQDFRKNIKPMGKIEYAEIHRHANTLADSGLISSTTSSTFWRKEGYRGRTEVDLANITLSDVIIDSRGKEITVPNVVDLVNKKYTDRNELLKTLIKMEDNFRASLIRESKLKVELENKKAENKQLKEKNIDYQKMLYKMFNNIMETRNLDVIEKTNYALNKLLINPIEFYSEDKKLTERIDTPSKNIKSFSRFKK